MSSDAGTIRDVIIGSGPAGHTAAVCAALADLKPLVFEASVTAGGARQAERFGGRAAARGRRHRPPRR